MRRLRPSVVRAWTMPALILALASVLVLKTVFAVLLIFPDYFPPNFRSDFLLGRQAYFFGAYQWAFYAHVVVGPFVLLSGLVLLNEPFRRRFSLWHRRLGRVHVVCVLFVVAPSGLWLAPYAASGSVAAAAFAALALATAGCAAMGWRAAVQRRFDSHRMWMTRCYVLLCSAVVLRVIGGASDVAGIEWTYPYAAWVSWLLPLLALETLRFTRPSIPLRQ